jgi:hypothetical protein
VIIDYSYTVNDTQLTFSLVDFTSDIPVCGSFTYVVEITSPMSATLPTDYLTFSNSTN